MRGAMVPMLPLILLPICILALASLFHAFRWPQSLGIGIGLVLGMLPILAIRWISPDRHLQFTLWINQLLLIALTLSVPLNLLPQLFSSLNPLIGRHLPLLISILLVYLTHLMLEKRYTTHTAKRTEQLQQISLVFSGPSASMSLLMGLVAASYVLLALNYLQLNYAQTAFYTDKFLDRGIIPPLTLILFFWGLFLFIGKFLRLWNENQSLKRNQISFTVSLWQAYTKRYPTATVTDWMDIVFAQAAGFYILPRYLSWAIPILGFIGTVLGISLAAEGIQSIIGDQQSLSQISGGLGQAISPLGIAFDTTLVALSLSLVLTLLQNLLQRWEDNFLSRLEYRVRQDDLPGTPDQQ